MNIFRSSGREYFLDEIFAYLSTNFKKQYEHVKIILPSGFLCSALQYKFLSIKNALILPNIITLSEIMAEGDEIFKMPYSSMGTLTPLEEKILLGEIIESYPKFNFNLSASIKFAPKLAKLFYEIESNQLQLHQLDEISGADEAKHWQDIYKFLRYAYDKWQAQITTYGKVSKAQFQQKMFDAEISRLTTESKSHLIIAGTIPVNKMERNFFSEVISLDTGHILLPHFPDTQLNEIINRDNVKPEHPLFKLKEFYQLLTDKNLTSSLADIKFLSDKNPVNTSFDFLLSPKFTSDSSQHAEKQLKFLEYVQFESIYDEAEYIGARCSEILTENADASIAIICSSTTNKHIYKRVILKYITQIRDLIGENILENNAICLLIEWAEFACCNFDLNKFFRLISNPAISCQPTIYLKNLLLKTNRFATNLADIASLLENADNKYLTPDQLAVTREWFTEYSITFSRIEKNSFTQILKQVIQNIEKIAPTLWAQHESFGVADAIREIYQTDWSNTKIHSEEFSELLRNCLEGGRLFTQDHDCKIVLGKMSDISFAQFDYTFIIDASEGNLPPTIGENPWLNKNAQEELGIYLNSNIYSSSIYNFYLNLGANNVCITRSSKQLASKDLLESSLLLQMKFNTDNIKQYIYAPPTTERAKITDNNEYVTTNQFPSQISATDIETLIRAPYNFYAKKILGLHAIDALDEYPTFAEFGNFFHAVAEQYTNQFDKIRNINDNAKLEIFNQIAEDLIAKISIPEYSKTTWITKISALASEFVEFENSRQKHCVKVYTEIKGSMELSLAGRTIKIIAIADRIEINKKGNAIIMDYKTGTPPTKQELLSGQSPQLIVEALIMQHGGFDKQIRDVESVIFVKIASSKPYIRLIEVELNKDELAKHMDGLKSVLTHYISTGKYNIEKCDSNYDDYHHLARR